MIDIKFFKTFIVLSLAAILAVSGISFLLYFGNSKVGNTTFIQKRTLILKFTKKHQMAF